jgi:hypothetical protein
MRKTILKTLVAVCDAAKENVLVYNISTKELVQKIPFPNAIAFAFQNDNCIVLASREFLEIWDIPSNRIIVSHEVENFSSYHGVDHCQIVVFERYIYYLGRVLLEWDTRIGIIRKLSNDEFVFKLNEYELVRGREDNYSIYIWNVQLSQLTTLDTAENQIQEKYSTVISCKRNTFILDRKNRKFKRKIFGYHPTIVSKDGTVLTLNKREVMIVSAMDGRTVQKLPCWYENISDVKVAQKGTLCVVCYATKLIIYDTEREDQVLSIPGSFSTSVPLAIY